MKVKMDKNELVKALSTTMRAVSLKANLPVLANVCLSTEGSKLKLSTTNLELGINYWIKANTQREGSLSVPARILLEFINALETKEVDLAVSGEILSINSDQGKATLAGIGASEFPPVPALEENNTLFLNPLEFQKAVNQVAFSASTDSGRAVLNGILLKFSPENLTLVATDGYRLSQKVFEVEIALNESVIIPAKSLYEISRVISESVAEGEELRLNLNREKNLCFFGLEKAHMATRLIDGEYPNYQQIIPPNFVTRVLLESSELAKSLRMVGVFARDMGSVVKIALSPPDSITLSSSTNQVGESQTHLKASVEGQEMALAFNLRYLQEALASITATQISLELASPTQPIVMRGVGDESYLHLIMPVRMQS